MPYEAFMEPLSSTVDRETYLGQPYVFYTTTTCDSTTLKPTANRMHTFGPYTPIGFSQNNILAYSGQSLYVMLSGATIDQKLRPILYQDDFTNTALLTEFGTTSGTGFPRTFVAVGTEHTVPANSAYQWRQLNFSAPVTVKASGFYWPGVWAENTASVASFRRQNNVSRKLVNTFSSAAPYHATNNPPSGWVSLGQTNVTTAQEISMYMPLAVIPATTTYTLMVPEIEATISGNVISIGVTPIRYDPLIATEITLSGMYDLQRSADNTTWQSVLKTSSAVSTLYDVLNTSGTQYYRVVSVFENTAITSNTVTVNHTVVSGQAVGNIQTHAYAEIPSIYAGMQKDGTSAERVPGTTASVSYKRQFNWVDLETVENTYDFSTIMAHIDDAVAAGMKAAFRMRCVVPGGGNLCPSYLSAYGTSYTGDFVPNWNDAYVLERINSLLSALIALVIVPRLNDIAFVDVGMIASYGEWADNPGGTAITDINGIALLTILKTDCDNAGIPISLFIMSLPSNELDGTLRTALSYGMGIRKDAFGNLSSPTVMLNLFGARSLATRRMLARHPYSVFIGEYMNAGSLTDPTSYTTAVNETQTLKAEVTNDVNFAGFASLSTTAQAAIQTVISGIGQRPTVVASIAPTATQHNYDSVVSLTIQNDGYGVARQPAPYSILASGETVVTLSSGIIQMPHIGLNNGFNAQIILPGAVSRDSVHTLLLQSDALYNTNPLILATNVAHTTFSVEPEVTFNVTQYVRAVEPASVGVYTVSVSDWVSSIEYAIGENAYTTRNVDPENNTATFEFSHTQYGDTFNLRVAKITTSGYHTYTSVITDERTSLAFQLDTPTPDTLVDFGVTAVGDSLTVQGGVSNISETTGTPTITVTEPYTIVNAPTAMYPGVSVLFTIRISAVYPGTYSGILNIGNDTVQLFSEFVTSSGILDGTVVSGGVYIGGVIYYDFNGVTLGSTLSEG